MKPLSPPNSPALGQRASPEELLRQSQLVLEHPCSAVFGNIPLPMLVVNNTRQIVYANARMLDSLKQESLDGLLGQRPGELLHCLFSVEHADGCGVSEYCRGCGALRAMCTGLAGQASRALTSVLSRGEGLNTKDLMIDCSHLGIGDEHFALLFIEDVTWRREERDMERMFFHDMLNLAGGIKGLIDIVAVDVQPNLRNEAKLMREGYQLLLDELALQAELKAACNGELQPEVIRVPVLELLRNVAGLYQVHPSGRGKQLRVASGTLPETIRTDPRIFTRVLGNLVKNALEAAPDGSEVVLGCRSDEGGTWFYVENEGAVSQRVRDALFTPDMESSESGGRGLGLRSVKLFVEKYLGGRVAFDGRNDGRVEFSVWLPKAPDESHLPLDSQGFEDSLGV